MGAIARRSSRSLTEKTLDRASDVLTSRSDPSITVSQRGWIDLAPCDAICVRLAFPFCGGEPGKAGLTSLSKGAA